MKKTARTIISAVLALSLSVVSCFALPTSRALVADNNQNYILPSYAWELASLREN